jgi:hypothetical protein
MPPVTVDQLQRAVEAVVNRRRAVEKRESALVTLLNEALKGLGYTVVPAAPQPASRSAPPARRRRGPR